MNPLIKSQLQIHFSPAQMQAFFAARSDDQLTQIVTAIDAMTPQQVIGFKRQLGAVHRQKAMRRKQNAKGHSAFGKLLLSLRDGDK